MAMVESWIHKDSDLGGIPTPGASPIPLRRGIASVTVSTVGFISPTFAILPFHYARNLAQGQ
jgi:hypothetical protein